MWVYQTLRGVLMFMIGISPLIVLNQSNILSYIIFLVVFYILWILYDINYYYIIKKAGM